MRVNLYAQNRHVVVVDGIPLSNFAEGDYLQIKLDGGGAIRTHGGDGPVMNITTAQGGKVTVGLCPTSPALGLMYEIFKNQSTSPRMFSVLLVTGVEEVIQASGCAFGEMPQFTTGGPSMQPRQFEIESLQIKLDDSAVEAIGGGLAGGLVG